MQANSGSNVPVVLSDTARYFNTTRYFEKKFPNVKPRTELGRQIFALIDGVLHLAPEQTEGESFDTKAGELAVTQNFFDNLGRLLPVSFPVPPGNIDSERLGTAFDQARGLTLSNPIFAHRSLNLSAAQTIAGIRHSLVPQEPLY